MSFQLTDDDLKIVTCSECRGEKRVKRTTRTSSHSTITEEVVCDACDGRGVALTSTGAKLFDFVREANRLSSF